MTLVALKKYFKNIHNFKFQLKAVHDTNTIPLTSIVPSSESSAYTVYRFIQIDSFSLTSGTDTSDLVKVTALLYVGICAK